MASEYTRRRFEEPPKKAQLSGGRLTSMSFGSLRHHLVASILQLCTIAATAAFLTFVLGEIIVIRAARDLPTAVTNPEGKMAQMVWILVVSLLVCTISNITSMLLSVTRRFREIGTMKCLGAFDRSILVLFLMEAMILGGAGALAGAMAGAVLTLLIALFYHGLAILTLSMIGHVLAATGITVITVAVLSIMGAAYPSWQASRMLPVEAMRTI